MKKPSLKETFPRWSVLSKLPDEVWKAPYRPADARCFEFVLFAIGNDQTTAAGTSSRAVYDISNGIVQDLLALQVAASSTDERVKLRYLQFETSAFALHIAIAHGESSSAFDWIHNGIDEHVSEENTRDFTYDRFIELATTRDDWIVAHRTVALQQWFSNFYYYCRNLATLHPVAHQLMPYAITFLAPPRPAHRFALRGLLFALNWATAYNDPSEKLLSEIALAYFDDETLSTSLRSQISVAFLTKAARLTDKTPAQWARWAVDHALGELDPVETLQVQLGVIESSSDWDAQRDSVLRAIDTIVLDLQARFPQPSAFIQRLDQAVKLLDFTIFQLHSFGRSDALLEILCHWYGIKNENCRSDQILFCMPTHMSGTGYLGQRPHILHHANTSAVETVNRITNACLGVALTISGQLELETISERPGVPDNAMSHEFDKVISGHYRWAEIDRAEYESAHALICIPGYPHPLQYMMQRAVGMCLPIAASLEKPLPDRMICRAVIWFSGEDNYSAMEAEALAGLMGTAGVECVCMSGQDSSKEDFLAMYSSSQYDLIWVAGHGSYDRWNPRSPSILVGRESKIGIDELLALPIANPEGRRRLLVLNICDSGAAAVFGGMHKLGLASMLSSCKQAVVGHLWPVDPLIAASIGIKLARELIRHQGNFFNAFQNTTSALQGPWITFVENLVGEQQFSIFDRLKNNERDLTNIFHAGSAAFFE